MAALGQPQGLPLRRAAKTRFFHTFSPRGLRSAARYAGSHENGQHRVAMVSAFLTAVRPACLSLGRLTAPAHLVVRPSRKPCYPESLCRNHFIPARFQFYETGLVG